MKNSIGNTRTLFRHFVHCKNTIFIFRFIIFIVKAFFHGFSHVTASSYQDCRLAAKIDLFREPEHVGIFIQIILLRSRSCLLKIRIKIKIKVNGNWFLARCVRITFQTYASLLPCTSFILRADSKSRSWDTTRVYFRIFGFSYSLRKKKNVVRSEVEQVIRFIDTHSAMVLCANTKYLFSHFLPI